MRRGRKRQCHGRGYGKLCLYTVVVDWIGSVLIELLGHGHFRLEVVCANLAAFAKTLEGP